MPGMHAALPADWADILKADLPALAVVLGSGLSSVAEGFTILARTPYAKIPGLPQSSVTGHHGELLLLTLDGRPFIGVSGRIHLYEGRGPEATVGHVRYLHQIGCKTLIVTNAAGCCVPDWKTGSWMLIRDQINLTGATPLTGSRFVDMSECYDPGLCRIFRAAAAQLPIALPEGVYLAVRGPQYETPAEVRAYRALGADAIGMSTVLEVIQARALGMRVAGFSCLTNPAAGMGSASLDHREVLDVGRLAAADFARLLRTALPELLA